MTRNVQQHHTSNVLTLYGQRHTHDQCMAQWECFAGSRYQRQGQLITPPSISIILISSRYLNVPALDTCFWHNSPDETRQLPCYSRAVLFYQWQTTNFSSSDRTSEHSSMFIFTQINSYIVLLHIIYEHWIFAMQNIFFAPVHMTDITLPYIHAHWTDWISTIDHMDEIRFMRLEFQIYSLYFNAMMALSDDWLKKDEYISLARHPMIGCAPQGQSEANRLNRLTTKWSKSTIDKKA